MEHQRRQMRQIQQEMRDIDREEKALSRQRTVDEEEQQELLRLLELQGGSEAVEAWKRSLAEAESD